MHWVFGSGIGRSQPFNIVDEKAGSSYRRVQIPTPSSFRQRQARSPTPSDSPVPEPLERRTLSDEFLEAQDRARESAREDRAAELRALALRIAKDRERALLVEEQFPQDRAADRSVAKLRREKEREMSYYRSLEARALTWVQMQSCRGNDSHRWRTTWGQEMTNLRHERRRQRWCATSRWLHWSLSTGAAAG